MKTIKIDKQSIFEELSKIEGVEAIKLDIPDIVSDGYEGRIEVLYKSREDYNRFEEGIKLSKKFRHFLKPNDIEIHIPIICQNNRDRFYSYSIESIVEVI